MVQLANKVAVLASASRTGTVNSDAIPVPVGAENLAVFIDATAEAGSVVVTVEWSPDGTKWFTDQAGADAAASVNGTDNDLYVVAVKGAYFRASCVVTGNLTFAVDAVGVG